MQLLTENSFYQSSYLPLLQQCKQKTVCLLYIHTYTVQLFSLMIHKSSLRCVCVLIFGFEVVILSEQISSPHLTGWNANCLIHLPPCFDAFQFFSCHFLGLCTEGWFYSPKHFSCVIINHHLFVQEKAKKMATKIEWLVVFLNWATAGSQYGPVWLKD